MSRIGTIGSPFPQPASIIFNFLQSGKLEIKFFIFLVNKSVSIELIPLILFFRCFAIASQFFAPSPRYANFNGISPLPL